MIGPTHLQKRLFGFLWASAKYSGLKSQKLILSEAADELGATDKGIKKAAEGLRDNCNPPLIWFDKTHLGRSGWTEVRFPRQTWMPRMRNTVPDSSKEANPEQRSENPAQSSRNPEHYSCSRVGKGSQRIRRNKRERERAGYDGPDW